MKHVPFLFLVILLAACGNGREKVSRQEGTVHADSIPPESGPAGKNHLIIPGKSIGRTGLGISSEQLIGLLKEPHSSDAAMGKAWLSWFGEGDRNRRLDVYTAYADSTMTQKVVKVIRVNSPVFATAEGIRTGAGLTEIRKVFPKLAKVSRKIDKQELYLIKDKGIGFILKGVICTDILVFEPGMDISNLYFP